MLLMLQCRGTAAPEGRNTVAQQHLKAGTQWYKLTTAQLCNLLLTLVMSIHTNNLCISINSILQRPPAGHDVCTTMSDPLFLQYANLPADDFGR